MRLTPEVLRGAQTYLNPLKQRELGLRSLSIAVIENLGVTEDIYDAIDFTDNQIFKLDNFPVLSRLKTLLCSKNRITTISPNIGKSLPNLESLILADNQISSVSELLHFQHLPTTLTTLVLAGNPVTDKIQNYRVIMIALVPSLTCLDYSSITDEERRVAHIIRQKLDRGVGIDRLIILTPQKYRSTAELEQSTFVPSVKGISTLSHTSPMPAKPLPIQLTPEMKDKLLKMIDMAETLEQIEQIEAILASGVLPDDFVLAE